MKKKSFWYSIGVVAALLAAVGAVMYWGISRSPVPSNVPPPSTAGVTYTNDQYGYKVSLPQNWRGYSVVTAAWTGDPVEQGAAATTGPLVALRNPQWTAQHPYQDIPLMIFTLAQWADLQQGKFHIGAAPINPSLLAFNEKYVIALPARYNYAFPEGWQEVDRLLQNHAVRATHPVSSASLPADSQTLLCGGIANGSTEIIPETTRLFVNLPKAVYTDKDHNIVITTVNGTATANWISNGGPYGEAFPANDTCWSYYYEFDGQGRIDITSKSQMTGQPDYAAHFTIVRNTGTSSLHPANTSTRSAAAGIGY